MSFKVYFLIIVITPNLFEGKRVFITGGGCNGFSYGFTFDNEIAEDDAEVVQSGVTMVVDSMSFPYLEGAAIQFVEDLNGSQFVVTIYCGRQGLFCII